MRAVHISAALLACAVAGCAIRSDVQPVGFGRVDSVCIERNDAVLMEGFLPALVKQIEARGVATEVYAGAPPADCRHRVTYTANWSWDMAMYLTYAQINVYDGVREGAPRIGGAVYDATAGGANLGKFGDTESKIAPLVEQLFPTLD